MPFKNVAMTLTLAADEGRMPTLEEFDAMYVDLARDGAEARAAKDQMMQLIRAGDYTKFADFNAADAQAQEIDTMHQQLEALQASPLSPGLREAIKQSGMSVSAYMKRKAER